MLRLRLKGAAATAALAAAALVLTGCATSAGGSASATDSITIGQVAEPEKAPDPIVDGSLAGYNYYYNEFDQLTKLSASGAVEPSLATKWTHSSDFTTWTYTIRDGVTFTNGDALTASDVAFTYNTILKTPDSDNLAYMGALKAVKATDDHTVVFTLNASYSPWPSITTAISIVPQKVYEKLGSAGFAKAPVGSGPYEFVSWTRGVSYVMKRNPDYWGTKPEVKKVTFQTVSDEDARLNGVSSGSLDLALISPNQVDSLAGNPAVSVESRAANGVTFLGTNSTKGALKNAKVRQAIELAIDKKSLAKVVLDGRAVPNDQIVAPGVGGFVDGFEGSGYDPAKAKALLAEAGYSGEKVPLEYATSGRIPLSSEIAQAIGGYLKAVGIDVDLVGMDQASLSAKIYGTVDMDGLYLNTWAPSTMDGDMPASNLFAGGQNDYAKSPALAALVKDQRTVAGDARTADFEKMATLNVDNGYIVPLFTPKADYALNSNLDWTPRVDGEIVVSAIHAK